MNPFCTYNIYKTAVLKFPTHAPVYSPVYTPYSSGCKCGAPASFHYQCVQSKSSIELEVTDIKSTSHIHCIDRKALKKYW